MNIIIIYYHMYYLNGYCLNNVKRTSASAKRWKGYARRNALQVVYAIINNKNNHIGKNTYDL